MAATSCPSREKLLQYSQGTLSGDQQNALNSHLDDCRVCQATIMTLDGIDDTVTGGLRMPPSSESVLAEPQLQNALLAAMSLPEKMRTAGADAKQAAPAMPEMLGEYRLLEELGRGGMGHVYKALHTKLDRVVAMKVLPRSRVGDPKAIARFEREIKVVARLSHPNIVQAYDARELDGMPVLVMEFVDGLDLAEIVRRVGPLPVAEACELVRQTAMALQCAYEHGLVHRDVKPSNVMLARSGDVKLLDLGLARFHAEDDRGISPTPGSEEMTGAGHVMGTVDYVAPEQAFDSRAVDIRADLYSLGCTLYKLLSGHAPFDGIGHQRPWEKLNAHLNEPVPPIRQFVPNLPKRLIAILDRLLAKDPADRFSTPAETAEALASCCAGADLRTLLRRAEAASPSSRPLGANRDQGGDSPLRLAASRRWKYIVRAAVLVLALGGFGCALGILITIVRDNKATTIEVPERSHTVIDKVGNATITLPVTAQATVAQRQVFVVGNSPYYQALTDMAQRKGLAVARSFNTQYDKWLPQSKGHLLIVETHDGVPIVPTSELDKFFPGASAGLKSFTGTTSVENTRIVFVDFSRLLNKQAINPAGVTGLRRPEPPAVKSWNKQAINTTDVAPADRRVFIIGNSPYWQTLTDMVRRMGMTDGRSFNTEYDKWLPAAKGHVLLIETHAGVPIVPPSVLDKVYPKASEGLKTTDGVVTVDATRIIFVDFSRLWHRPEIER
jgi:serine/threonine protein kinase